MTSKKFLITSLVSAFVILMMSGAAIAANCSTSITAASLPCTIATSNNYILTGPVAKPFSTSAITINASDVVLDLNGYTIKNTNTGVADGIGTTTVPTNVTIRNGKINGFYRGINFSVGSGHIIDNVNIDALQTGITIEASNSIIRNNVVKSGSRGIIICEADVRVLNNEIISNGGGIDSCSDTTVRAIIEGNRITNPAANGGNGIYLPSSGTLVVNNRFVNWAVGISGPDTPEVMKYRDNLFVDVPVDAYATGTGVTNVSNNN